MTIECDVLVVGGGPAGSSAARAAARKGAKTILIEKQEKISQVPCGEGVGSYLFPFLPFKIPQDQLIWRIEGMSFSDGETEIIQKSQFYKGWSLDREKFDDWMIKNAQNSGSQIMMGAEFIDLKSSKDHQIKKVLVKHNSKIIEFEPKIIIAADGVESNVAEKLGVLQNTHDSIGYVVSWEMKDVKLKYQHLEQMFFGDFAPRAYAYVFPKSKNSANIGVGSTKGDKNLERNFNKFLEEIIPTQTKDAIKTVERSGKVPIKNRIPKQQLGNVIFTGDTANQNFKPYEEGILPSIICGDIAGNIAASKDISKYEKTVTKKFENQFEQSREILKKMYDMDQIDKSKRDLIMMYLFAFMESNKIDQLIEKNVEEIKEILIQKSRHVNSFITMFLYFVWYLKVLTTRRD